MKSFVLIVGSFIFLLPSFSQAYKCEVRKWHEGTKKEVIWNGEMALKQPIDARVVILTKPPIELDEVVKSHPQPQAYKKAMSKYNGQLLVGLASVDGMLKLSQGTVDANQKNMGPYEAIAWADPAAKKLGVKNFQRNIEIECEK